MAVPLSTAFAHGAAADRPTASATIEGQFYFSEDTGDFSQVQAGAWVTVAASGGDVQVTHFTQAMLLDLHNTAVDIWPAPDADEAILPRRIVTRFVPAPVAPADYEFAPETAVLTYYGAASATGSADTASLPFADQTGCVGTLTVPVFGGPNGGPTAAYRGQPLRLKADLPLTTGNGTLDVTVVADVVAV